MVGAGCQRRCGGNNTTKVQNTVGVRRSYRPPGRALVEYERKGLSKLGQAGDRGAGRFNIGNARTGRDKAEVGGLHGRDRRRCVNPAVSIMTRSYFLLAQSDESLFNLAGFNRGYLRRVGNPPFKPVF